MAFHYTLVGREWRSTNARGNISAVADQDYNLEIGASLDGLAGKVWHIGFMGYASHLKSVMYCLGAGGRAGRHEKP